MIIFTISLDPEPDPILFSDLAPFKKIISDPVPQYCTISTRSSFYYGPRCVHLLFALKPVLSNSVVELEPNLFGSEIFCLSGSGSENNI
jgi:hypothetical protein